MATWKLWFVLLMQLAFCIYSEETRKQVVKTIGKELDVTAVCTNSTESIITLMVCTIREEKSGEQCRLLYRFKEGFVHKCGSRFTLMMENQTAYLQLVGLTPEDSGTYTCQCTQPSGTYILFLNITVEEDEDEDEEEADARGSEMSLLDAAVIGTFIFITITGVILGFICQKFHHRRRSEPLTSHANTEPDYIEPYSTYIQRENSLYSTVRMH